MNYLDRVTKHIEALKDFSDAGPRPILRGDADEVLAELLEDFSSPQLPATLHKAANASLDDYLANWNHQMWYHLDELLRIHEDRFERRDAQGPDRWTGLPKPSKEDELASQLRELAKLRALIDRPPQLVDTTLGVTLFEDAMLDKPDAWDIPPGLSVERDPEKGVAWKGQNPGGDWFWIKQPFTAQPASFEVDLLPLSTIVGGLIIGFCTQPLRGTPLVKASGNRMIDYYANFDTYHFSVHRGSTGYCNLRRCGPGLLMLASFDDPCNETGRWYRLQIVKDGPQIELRVDGELVCCYLDLGYIVPMLDGGHFGLRHFQGFYGWQRNVRVSALA